MLKAAAHIRPVFRAHGTPDLFTPNPSLLHHLPANGVGNSLVGAAQSSASAGGSGSAGAGRAGGGYQAGSGGYSGHARAFLSLPQTANGDASSSLIDDRDQKHAPRIRLLPSRLAVPPSQPSGAELRARAAPTVRLVQLDADSASLSTSAPRRSSITYPAWGERPALDRKASAPGQQRSLSTSPPPRPLVGPAAEVETRQIGQPNRVLMDLAGADVARPRRVQQLRRNSTAFMPQTASASSPLPPPAPLDSSSGEDRAAYDEADDRIRRAILDARNAAQPEAVHALVAHYRTPRGGAGAAPANEALARRFPLPPGFSTAGYNACLQATLGVRARGDAIAPVLDMYNEMLERDLVPNAGTYATVIRALCLREADIAAASRRHAAELDWRLWRAEKLGIAADESADVATESIEGYRREGNLASALKLFRAAATFSRHGRGFYVDVYADLVSACGGAAAANADTALALWREAHGGGVAGANLLYSPVLRVLAEAKRLDDVRSVWAHFVTHGSDAALWAKSHGREPADVAACRREAYGSYLQALIACGDLDTVLTVLKTLSAPEAADRLSAPVLNTAVHALGQHGHADLALDMFRRSLDPAFAGTLAGADHGGALVMTPAVTSLADSLALAGRVGEAVDVIVAHIAELGRHAQALVAGRGRFARVYAAALAAAAHADPAALDALATLTAAVPLRFDADLVSRHVSLLVASGRFGEIAPALDAFAPRPLAEGTAPALREALALLIASPAPLADVLAAVRAFARHRELISDANDRTPVAPAIVEKYLVARAAADSAAALGLSPDAWFRLIEAVVALHPSTIESGDADAALERLADDLAALRAVRFALPEGLAFSPSVAALSRILAERFGLQRAGAIRQAAFGAAPSPELAHAFVLPPTPAATPPPPSTPQPASRHTLHISPELSSAIDKHASARPDVTALQAYERVRRQLTDRNAVPHPQAMGRLVASLGRAGDGAKARELYALGQVVLASCVADPREQGEGWRALEDGMLTAACHVGQLEAAGMHRARLVEAGMAPSADAYATMIASAKDTTDDATVARELFEESQALGVRPHLYLYNTVISRLSKARKAEDALELFKVMKQAGIRPSTVTYGAVINACCRVGDAESATTLFEEMSSARNFKARVPPYNSMMQFHLNTRPSRDLVLSYYDKMRAAGVRPSSHTYKLLLDTYGTLAPIDLVSMERVFSELCDDPAVPVAGTHWASLIMAYGVHAGEPARALATFEAYATHPTTRDPVPEPVVWEAALSVLGHHALPSGVADMDALLARMRESGASSTAYVCNALITGYANHGALERARAVFASMGDSVTGVAAPNNHPQLLTSSGHVKPVTRTDAPTDVVFREPSTYEAMVRAEVRAGNREAAESLLAMMEERRYPVAVYMKVRALLDEA